MLRTLYIFFICFLYSCQEPKHTTVNEEKKDSTETDSQGALPFPVPRDIKPKAPPMQNPGKQFRLSTYQKTKGIPVHPEKAEDILFHE